MFGTFLIFAEFLYFLSNKLSVKWNLTQRRKAYFRELSLPGLQNHTSLVYRPVQVMDFVGVLIEIIHFLFSHQLNDRLKSFGAHYMSRFVFGDSTNNQVFGPMHKFGGEPIAASRQLSSNIRCLTIFLIGCSGRTAQVSWV